MTICGLALCLACSEYYVTPEPSARWWPDLSPAQATIYGIMLINTAVFIAWRIPPLWRTLNKYFVSVPAVPYSVSLIGSFFSHQSFTHLLVNMSFLYLCGIDRKSLVSL